MTGEAVNMHINGALFKVPLCPEHDKAVRRLASGEAFAGGSLTLRAAVDAVLGDGACSRIIKGRRVDVFDLIDMAVYICARYAKAVAERDERSFTD